MSMCSCPLTFACECSYARIDDTRVGENSFFVFCNSCLKGKQSKSASQHSLSEKITCCHAIQAISCCHGNCFQTERERECRVIREVLGSVDWPICVCERQASGPQWNHRDGSSMKMRAYIMLCFVLWARSNFWNATSTQWSEKTLNVPNWSTVLVRVFRDDRSGAGVGFCLIGPLWPSQCTAWHPGVSCWSPTRPAP